MYLPSLLPLFVEMMADTSSLNHPINQAFPIFLTHAEKHGKAWIRGYHTSTSKITVATTVVIVQGLKCVINSNVSGSEKRGNFTQWPNFLLLIAHNFKAVIHVATALTPGMVILLSLLYTR